MPAPSDPHRSEPAPSGPALSPRESLGALLVALLAAAALFAEPLFGDRCTLSFGIDDPRIDVRPWSRAAEGVDPATLGLINPITPDIDLFVLPGAVRMRQFLEQGELPSWDSGQLCGYPLAGNVPYPYSSPLTWPTLLVDPITGFDVMLWVHTALAAFLAWRTARLFGAGSAAAAVAGVGFALSAWMVTRWHLPQIAYTTTWWPGVLGAAAWMRAGRLRRGVLEGSACLALAMVSGFPQVALAEGAGLLLFTLFDRRLRRLPVLAAVGGVGVLAALLAAPVFALGGAAYAPSLRATESARASTAAQGLPPAALVGLLLPEFFGRPSDFASPDPPAPRMEDHLPQRLFWSDDVQDNVVENAVYPGLAVVVLALLALRVGGDARRLVCLGFVAVGVSTAWPYLADSMPGLAALGAGNIKRLLVLWAGTAPLAAALALQAVLDGRVRAPTLTAVVLVAVTLAVPFGVTWLDAPGAVEFASRLESQAVHQVLMLLLLLGGLMLLPSGGDLARPAVETWKAWLPALVLAVDLGGNALAFNPFPVQPSEAFATRRTLESLQAREGRVAVLGGSNLLPPTAATTFGIRSVHGVAPMVGTRVVELLECVQAGLADRRDPRIVRPFSSAAALDHPVLDLLGVDTVVHADPALLEAPGARVIFADEREGLAVMARAGAGPRAFVSGGAQVVPDAAARRAWLSSPPVEIHASVLLEVAPTGLDLSAVGAFDAVEVVASPNRFEMQTDSAFDGILVLTEAHDAGWRVTVDGESASVLVADHALLGVPLPSGRHRVVLSYTPPGLGLSVAATGLALVIWFALLLAGRRRATPGGLA